MSTYNFKPHVKGDTFLGAEFRVTDGVNPIDLTDFRIRMHLRRQASQTAALIKVFDTNIADTMEIHDAADGRFRILRQIVDIPAFDYVYDIEFISPTGRVRTWLRGKFPVIEEVTYD